MVDKNLGDFANEMFKIQEEKKEKYKDTWIKCESELLQEKLKEKVNTLNLNNKCAKRRLIHIANYCYFLFERLG